MKRKIGELRNVPIVEGDKNLVREGTEIHINDLQSKGGSSSGGGKMEYYKLNKEKYGDEQGSPLHILFRISGLYPSIIKVNDENSNIYVCVPFPAIMSPETKLHDIISIWKGIAFDSNIKTYAHIPEDTEYNCDNLSELISFMETKFGISWKDDALIPITEEEFYKLD